MKQLNVAIPEEWDYFLDKLVMAASLSGEKITKPDLVRRAIKQVWKPDEYYQYMSDTTAKIKYVGNLAEIARNSLLQLPKGKEHDLATMLIEHGPLDRNVLGDIALEMHALGWAMVRFSHEGITVWLD